jgi:hypothetical protein
VHDFAKQFVSDLHRSTLKPRGFTKKNHTFTRQRDGYLERLQVQGSSWNSSTDQTWTFYLNAGVQFADLPEPTSNRGFPGTHIYGRLSSFASECADTFDLTVDNADRVRTEVVESIERVLNAIADARLQIHEAAQGGRMLWHHGGVKARTGAGRGCAGCDLGGGPSQLNLGPVRPTRDSRRMMSNECIAELLTCAQRLAGALHLAAPPDAEIESTIRHVLVDRQAFAAAAEGIITRAEAANLLLAHLHTLICDHAGVAFADEVTDDRLRIDVEHALFGLGK